MLVIGPEERAKIATAIERAKAKIIPWDKLRDYVLANDVKEVNLGDRPKGFERVQSENVIFEGGYRAAISFEEQPAGICRHLSVSVMAPGAFPHPAAVEFIAREFGMEWPPVNGRAWIEEFAPGHHAINLLDVDQPREAPPGRQ